LSALLIAPVTLLAMASLDWFLVKQALRIEFRDVQWITTAELSDWLANSHRSQPILLDVRTRAEWEVSHLPSARWVDPETDPATALAGISKETPIVTYCSVGYRSAKAARRLRADGYNHVQNLEGSIFAWANEGRPLLHGDQVVRQVHPYSTNWARLLQPAVRAPISPSP
jgi:rhodanese-related sulfurtransferase